MCQVWLLDVSRRLAPIGTPAEICFGGIVAAGYLGQAELTEARFLPNPLLAAHSPCGRQLAALGMSVAVVRDDAMVPTSPTIFATGDMAVRLATGALRYIGRADRQVRRTSHGLTSAAPSSPPRVSTGARACVRGR